MHPWLQHWEHVAPSRVALVVGEQQWTFAELAAQVRARAALYAAPPPAQIGIVADNSVDAYLGILAAHARGHRVALFNPRLAGPELASHIAAANCAEVWASAPDRERVASLGVAASPWPVTETSLPGRVPETGERADLTEGDLAWADRVATVVYTSGTTGRPKGVMHTFAAHWHSAMASLVNLGCDPGRDGWVCAMPLCHVSGLSIVMRGLIYGMRVHLQPRFDALAMADALLKGEATLASVVAPMLEDVLEAWGERDCPPHVRALLVGGGPASPALLARCAQRRMPVVFSYGMTETASQIVAARPQEPGGTGSVGWPLPGVDVRVADGAQCGELEVRTPSLACGYAGQPGAFEQRLTPDGWFRTSDVGWRDDEGSWHIEARMSDLIVSGGENVFPAEVERCLGEVEGVRDVAVVGVAHERWGMVPVAYVVATAQVSDAAILAHASAHLARYKVPADIRRVTALPRTSGGKLQRHLLLDAHAGPEMAQ